MYRNPMTPPPPLPQPPMPCPCCPPCPPPPHPLYPASGLMQGNVFFLNNSNPYLVDNTRVEYGPLINVADEVYTRFTQARDASCVNVTGCIDLTDAVLTNTVLNSYLTSTIENQHETIDGVLDLLKDSYTCKITYDVLNSSNAIASSGTSSVTVDAPTFHATELRDYFLSVFKNVMIFEIPALEFQGLYTLRFRKFEIIANAIDTSTHIVNDQNPYYQFISNNTKIAVQHDTIAALTTDRTVTIASVDMLQTFPFQGNLTTRVKLTFTAFIASMISTPNTYDVWSAMFEPTSAEIEELQNDVTDLQTRMTTAEADIADLQAGGGSGKRPQGLIHSSIVTEDSGGALLLTADYLPNAIVFTMQAVITEGEEYIPQAQIILPVNYITTIEFESPFYITVPVRVDGTLIDIVYSVDVAETVDDGDTVRAIKLLQKTHNDATGYQITAKAYTLF